MSKPGPPANYTPAVGAAPKKDPLVPPPEGFAKPQTPKREPAGPGEKTVLVRGHFTKTGKWVAPYWRRPPHKKTP